MEPDTEERVRRNPERTKARLLDAAMDEFAGFGLAGGRIDRIAERAGANKRLLYAYFGNKEEVFAAVVTACVEELNDSVEFSVTDLPGYSVRVFDFFVAHPRSRLVLAWRDVENATPTAVEVSSYRQRLRAVRAEQRAGRLSDAVSPPDLIAAVEAVIGSRLNATVGLRAAAGLQSRESQRRHRDAISHIVGLICTPA